MVLGTRHAIATIALLLPTACGAGNQALYEPSYGGAAPQCGIADTRPYPSSPPAWNPPASTPGAPVPRQIALQPWDQHAQASQMIARIAAAGATIGRMLEQARAQRDVVKTLCLNDKLTQIDVALRSAIERKVSLTDAAGRGDPDLSSHEFTVITVLRQRVDQLTAEANQCVGEEAAFSGETRVVTTVDVASVQTRVPGVMKAPPRQQRDESARITPAPPAAPPPRGASGRSFGAQGATAPPVASPTPRPPAAVVAPPPPPLAGSTSTPASVLTVDAPHDASLMVYSAEVGLAVRHVGNGLDAIEAIAREEGGFLSQRADRQITILVPRDRFVDALGRIERLGDVLHHAISSLDVTDEFVDLEVRLTNARAVRERLLVLRAAATAVMDQIEIEKELGRVTGEIDRMEGKLKLLREKIAYSTITVSLQPVAEPMVCATTVLPFPWLQDVGLAALLNVHE